MRAHRHLRRYVLAHERAVFASRLHWATLLEPILTTVAATVVVALLHQATGMGGVWVLWLLPAGRLALRWAEWNYQWFVATDKRLLLTYGFVVHKVAMMPMLKVTDMSYTRTPMGQVLGYGRFVMESAGQDQALSRVNYVPDPDVTYRKLTDTIFFPNKSGTPEARPAPTPPAIVPVGKREPRPTTAELPTVGPAGPAEHREPGPDSSAQGIDHPQSTGPAQGADHHVDVAPFDPEAPPAQEGPRSRTRRRGLFPVKRKQDLYEPPTSSGAGPTVPEPFL